MRACEHRSTHIESSEERGFMMCFHFPYIIDFKLPPHQGVDILSIRFNGKSIS